MPPAASRNGVHKSGSLPEVDINRFGARSRRRSVRVGHSVCLNGAMSAPRCVVPRVSPGQPSSGVTELAVPSHFDLGSTHAGSEVVLRRKVAVVDLGLLSGHVGSVSSGSIGLSRSHFGSTVLVSYCASQG